MEWLNDPKNKNVVAGGLAALIVLAGFAFWFFNIRTTSDDGAASAPPPVESTATTTGDPNTPQTTPPGADATAVTPPASATPAAGQAPPAGAQTASAEPMEAWRADPFMPIGYKPPVQGRKPKPPIADFPFISLVPPRLKDADAQVQVLAQPMRRMSGIMVNDKAIFAIIESNGQSEIYRPGDTLKDRLAVVERIERDRVILKTKDVKPRYIIVRMATSGRASSASSDPGVSEPTMGTDRPSRPNRGRAGAPAMGPEADFN